MKIAEIKNIEYDEFQKLTEKQRAKLMKDTLNYVKQRINRYQKAMQTYEQRGKQWLLPKPFGTKELSNGRTILTNYMNGKPLPIYYLETQNKYDAWSQFKELKNYLEMKRSTVRGAEKVLRTTQANIKQAVGVDVKLDEVADILQIAENEMDEWQYLKSYERWRIAYQIVKESKKSGVNPHNRNVINDFMEKYQMEKDEIEQRERSAMSSWDSIWRETYGTNGLPNDDEEDDY